MLGSVVHELAGFQETIQGTLQVCLCASVCMTRDTVTRAGSSLSCPSSSVDAVLESTNDVSSAWCVH